MLPNEAQDYETGISHFKSYALSGESVQDDLLTQDGAFLYSDKSTKEFDIKAENGEVRFVIPSNPWVHLSSNSESYKPGHVIRAFTIRTEINKSDFAFAFVIRTNPF